MPLIRISNRVQVGRDLGSGLVRVERGPHYAQASFGEDGRILCEVVSNALLEGEARLLPVGERALLAAGWRPPVPDCELAFCSVEHRNYWWFASPALHSIQVAGGLMRALERAYFVRPSALQLSWSPEIDEVVQARRADVRAALARLNGG